MQYNITASGARTIFIVTQPTSVTASHHKHAQARHMLHASRGNVGGGLVCITDTNNTVTDICILEYNVYLNYHILYVNDCVVW